MKTEFSPITLLCQAMGSMAIIQNDREAGEDTLSHDMRKIAYGERPIHSRNLPAHRACSSSNSTSLLVVVFTSGRGTMMKEKKEIQVEGVKGENCLPNWRSVGL